MKSIFKKGFTLIELLVVIAIIGILSAVIFANLGTTRNKGSDSAIKEVVHSFANQVELYYDTNGGYGTQAWVNPCTTAVSGGMYGDTKVNAILGNIDANNSSNGTVACAANGTSYVLIAQLVLDPSKYWCVDSKGIKKRTSTAPGNTAAGAGTYLVSGVYGCYNN